MLNTKNLLGANRGINSTKRVITLLLLGLMLGICILTIFWGADRGIGQYDDAEYLLSARFPDEVQFQVTSVYQYTGLLFELVGYNVAKFRQLGAVMLLSGGLIFWYGFTHFTLVYREYFSGARSLSAVSLPLFCLAALCHYSWFYMTPNYNTLTGLSISVAGGLVLSILAGLAKSRVVRLQSAMLAILAGISLGLLFFVKFSASVSILALIVVVIAAWNDLPKSSKTRILLSIVTGYSTAFIIHFTLFQPFHQWVFYSTKGIEIYASVGLYDLRAKLLSYVADFLFFVFSAGATYWPAIILSLTAGIGAVYSRGMQAARQIAAVSACISCSYVLITTLIVSFDIDFRYVNDPFIPRYMLFHFAFILILILCFLPELLLRSGDRADQNGNLFLFILMLILLPFAGSVGVTHALYSTAVVYPVTWFGAILALLMARPFYFARHSFLSVLLVLGLGGITSLQIVFGYLYDSQQIFPTTLHQKRPTEIADAGNIMKLDEDLSVFIEELRALAQSAGFQHGDDVIAVHFLQRVVYAIGGRSPVIANYAYLETPSAVANFNKRSEIALSQIREERLKRAFVLVNVPLPQVGALLRSRGLDLPDSYSDNNSYEHVGDVRYRGTYYTLFKPKLTAID